MRSKSCWFLLGSTIKLLTTLVSTGSQLNVFKPLMASAAVSSKAVVLLLLIRCLLLLQLFVGDIFCLRSAMQHFAVNIFPSKRQLFALI